MEKLIKELSEKHPDELPIVKSKYIPDCVIGRTKVWRKGKETITDPNSLFPKDTLQYYIRDYSTENQSWSSKIFHLISRLTVFTVGMGCKFFLKGINTTVLHGEKHLEAALSRPSSQPLISVFNHNSCFDDPGLMGGILSVSQLADYKGMRWSIAASEVIYTTKPLSQFWALGKVVPVVRGWTPKQPAIDFLIERLNEGAWVNIFPEAKVIDNHFDGVYKWGVGRLMAECRTAVPIFLPIYHVGMNRVLPNPQRPGEGQPMVIRPGNLVTVCIGEPVDLTDALQKAAKLSEQDAWAFITQEIQASMQKLEVKARDLHKADLLNWLKRWHDEKEVYFHILT